MIYANLTMITTDGINAEEVELRRFDENECFEWLMNNVWGAEGDYQIDEWEDNHHNFIKFTSDAEGVFIFAYKGH